MEKGKIKVYRTTYTDYISFKCPQNKTESKTRNSVRIELQKCPVKTLLSILKALHFYLFCCRSVVEALMHVYYKADKLNVHCMLISQISGNKPV